MSNRLTRSLHQLRPLLLRARAMPRQAAPAAPAALPQALEQTLELDALTSWPTHRIRSFLSSRTVR
ncbi:MULTISPECIES: hypothetical protein [Comamonas]|uniref:hypothetical protein n=1 Tax=Comamonas TaxID=283 RepID=UPI0001BB190B|nr:MULTISPECIES: hypothetical protein [Comamonas]ACY35029.1 hypothetical protein CtCNB1_4283 [Comamonas thiooxydans]MBL5976912.1 hypothetical protein [Comamonas sp. NyZ500]MDO1473534.1 hypothetical protein [Comamonas thiooxydans]QOQ81878.1 hypothetical protein INP81_21570 [Comamonas thiooxydans]UUE92356.1 hypothetical protein MJ608_15540 [Comamonas thiooxydans]